MLKAPRPIGPARQVFKPVFGKSAMEQDFQNPKTGGLDTFLLFDYKNGTPAAIIFALTADKKVITLRQFRPGSGEAIYEIPGGVPKPNELPHDAAKRELRDETGFAPDETHVLAPKPIWFEPANLTWGFWPCLGLNCKESGPVKHERTEHIEVELFSISDWMDMIRTGIVCDSKSITATALALMFLNPIKY